MVLFLPWGKLNGDCFITLCILETSLTITFANSEDPDEMQYNSRFHQGLHYLSRLKQTFRDRNTP